MKNQILFLILIFIFIPALLSAAPAPPADGLPAPDPVEVEEPPPDSGDDGGGPPAAPLPADCVSVANPDPVAVPEVDDDLLHEAGTVVVSDEVVGVFPGC